MEQDYKEDLGERLRRIRNQQGLTLQDVEDRSEGEWKAVVVGSYERGDRAISVAKLARLAEFYGVPVSELLPDATTADESPSASLRIIIDLTRIDSEQDGAIGALARYARTIQIHRGDYNGRMLTLRSDDVRAIAAACGMEHERLIDTLDERKILVHR